MIKLSLQEDPFWLELGSGVRVLVKPLDSLLMAHVQSLVKFNYDAITPIEDDKERGAYIRVLLIECLAGEAILDWEGVFEKDGVTPAELERHKVSQLMDIWYIGQSFYEQYTSSLNILHLEGNGSRTAAHGISAAAPDTV